MKHNIRINGEIKAVDCELGSGILDKKHKYKELIKDFATDSELAYWAKDIVEECDRKFCAGVVCFSAPQSENARVGVNADFSTAMFLIKAILHEVSKSSGISPTFCAASLMWYLAQVETGSILEEEKVYNNNLMNRAKEFAIWNLTRTIDASQNVHWFDDTPIAKQIKHVD